MPGRFLQGESRLHAEREALLRHLNIPMAAAVGAWNGNRETTTLPFLELGDPRGVQTVHSSHSPGGREGQRRGSRKMQRPQNSQMTAPGTERTEKGMLLSYLEGGQ